ncbi:unnamed protein product [Prorocentrum cordatum]|uniref:Uncharacterized protein n=1 Tax=Prorocentrum cordatum TaxID=2364126 RepID=A0ABN9SDV1_9DINO|nr:unnamed protein product [Polarella glacialis]
MAETVSSAAPPARSRALRMDSCCGAGQQLGCLAPPRPSEDIWKKLVPCWPLAPLARYTACAFEARAAPWQLKCCPLGRICLTLATVPGNFFLPARRTSGSPAQRGFGATVRRAASDAPWRAQRATSPPGRAAAAPWARRRPEARGRGRFGEGSLVCFVLVGCSRASRGAPDVIIP